LFMASVICVLRVHDVEPKHEYHTKQRNQPPTEQCSMHDDELCVSIDIVMELIYVVDMGRYVPSLSRHDEYEHPTTSLNLDLEDLDLYHDYYHPS